MSEIQTMIDTIEYNTPLYIDRVAAGSYSVYADNMPAVARSLSDLRHLYTAVMSGNNLYMDRETGDVWTADELRADGINPADMHHIKRF